MYPLRGADDHVLIDLRSRVPVAVGAGIERSLPLNLVVVGRKHHDRGLRAGAAHAGHHFDGPLTLLHHHQHRLERLHRLDGGEAWVHAHPTPLA
jgi:hypothetical protein